MIVRCTACTTRYRVDPAALGETGRRLRCTRCGHVWHETPPIDVPEPPVWAARPASERRSSAWIGWIAAGSIVAIVLAGLALGRNLIVERWPGTVRHYDAVGLSIGVPLVHGLRIVRIESERVHEEDRTTLFVQGVVENTIGVNRRVPALQATLADEAGTALHRWPLAAVSRVLDGGQSTTFKSWLADPPAGAVRLSVEFVADDRE